MAPSTLTTVRPSRVLGVAGLALTIYVWYFKSRARQLDILDAADRKHTVTGASAAAKGSATRRVGVDRRFVQQMKKLLPICIPGISSHEAGLLAALAAVLIARTWLDIWFSGFNGLVVKSIVSRDRKAFIGRAIVEFGIMMWPLSIVNNSLKLCISSLALSFRTRLTRYAHQKYLNGITFYKVSNIDNRITNADQLLTQDIDKWSESLAHLYSDIAKPIVDIFLFAYKLGQAIGREAPVYMIGYFLMSGVFLRSLSPPFGKYTAHEQKLEGDFRFTHSRIITHSEEIGFYGGGDREREIVNASFDKIVEHATRVIRLKFANGIIDSIAVKYLATMLAYTLLARPVFDPRYATEFMGSVSADPTRIMEDYSRNSGYLVNLSQAVGRIILAGRDLTRFAGYTSRVAELFTVLQDINEGRYESTMVASEEDAQQGVKAKHRAITQKDLKGQVEFRDGIIEFDRVPIVTPNGDVLVKDATFKVESGMNVLVTGPNGSGKSSLFRILGDLWPLFGGKVVKPRPEHLFYVPQKPYLALGTLRDQVIYPHSKEQALQRGYDDAKIRELMHAVRLTYLIDREGGLNSVQDWAQALSGGEKQRVGMARLFYHRPQFAILDECSSQVSVDIEALMYEHARELGISLFTVSHRASLVRHHEYLLRFDGEGGFEFSRIDDTGSVFAFSHGKSKYLKSEKQELPTEEGNDDASE